MILVNSLAYIVLVVSFIAIVTIKNDSVMTSVYAISCCIMSWCMTYSMHKLKNFSQLLASDGIIASQRLLVFHVSAFWVVSVLETGNSVATILYDSHFNEIKPMTKRSYNLALA